MKIINNTNLDAVKAYGANTAERLQPARETGEKQGNTVSIQDKINISPKVKMFQDIRQAALKAPEIREGKIRDIEQKISNGTYRPDYSVVADKLLSPNISAKI